MFTGSRRQPSRRLPFINSEPLPSGVARQRPGLAELARTSFAAACPSGRARRTRGVYPGFRYPAVVGAIDDVRVKTSTGGAHRRAFRLEPAPSPSCDLARRGRTCVNANRLGRRATTRWSPGDSAEIGDAARSAPPSSQRTKSCGAPSSAEDTYASRLPSGDQRGERCEPASGDERRLRSGLDVDEPDGSFGSIRHQVERAAHVGDDATIRRICGSAAYCRANRSRSSNRREGASGGAACAARTAQAQATRADHGGARRIEPYHEHGTVVHASRGAPPRQCPHSDRSGCASGTRASASSTSA